jgi:hypothetical protein
LRCLDCNREKEEQARIRIELVDKKSKEPIEIVYGEVVCVDCLMKRYKGKTKIRIYV